MAMSTLLFSQGLLFPLAQIEYDYYQDSEILLDDCRPRSEEFFRGNKKVRTISCGDSVYVRQVRHHNLCKTVGARLVRCKAGIFFSNSKLELDQYIGCAENLNPFFSGTSKIFTGSCGNGSQLYRIESRTTACVFVDAKKNEIECFEDGIYKKVKK